MYKIRFKMRLGVFFLILCVLSTNAIAKDLTDKDLDVIAMQPETKTIQFKVWDTYETFDFKSVFPCESPCNHVGWPAIFANYKKPIRWIQVVRFNKPGLGDVKENLPSRLLKYSYDEWVFLDGTNTSAPYMYEEEADRVFDNPAVTYTSPHWGKDEPLVWEAFLFGIKENKQNSTIKPIFGAYWGYKLPRGGKPAPLQPKELSRKDFKKLVKQYNIDSFITDFNGFKIIY